MSTTTHTMTTQEARRRRRRVSTSYTGHKLVCRSLPPSLEALDLTLSASAAAAPTLVTLRVHVLSYLADLESRLSLFLSPDDDAAAASSSSSSDAPALPLKLEGAFEEARAWARDGLEMLHRIRDDVCDSLPDFNVELESVKSHLPDMPDLAALTDLHLPDLPDLAELRTRLSDVRDRLSDFDFDFDFQSRLAYIPTLSEHMDSLQAHLASIQLPSSMEIASFQPSAVLEDLLDRLQHSEFIESLTGDDKEDDSLIERAAKEMSRAVKRSMEGATLIHYHDLPEAWKNNEFVKTGYRFIPLDKWPLIVLSLFAFHNETLNIHTHFIPFFHWLIRSLPHHTLAASYDIAERTYIAFALVCLFNSAVWHTMTGCAHWGGMDFCAKLDYVGIGWLIAASVGTVVHYGFRAEHRLAHDVFLGLCALMGLTGTFFPFMSWFNNRRYKGWRICFFLSLAFIALAPMGYIAYLTSLARMLAFVAPLVPSFVSYLTGLAFYATHFPECCLAHRPGFSRWMDRIGGGSHAIWHMFIIVAISQHKAAMPVMRAGVL